MVSVAVDDMEQDGKKDGKMNNSRVDFTFEVPVVSLSLVRHAEEGTQIHLPEATKCGIFSAE